MALMAAVITLSGCSKYGYVNVKYPVAPQAYFPEHVKTIALVNRSFSSAADKQKSILESIATAEIAGSDKLASDECLMAVYDNGNGQAGVNFVIPSKSKLQRKGSRETPELLEWRMVKQLCDSSKADALLVLETFDSNSDFLINTALDKLGTVLNGGTPTTSLPNNVQVDVLVFWRLYDPSTQKIVDQHQWKSYLNYQRVGSQYTMPPPDVLRNTAYNAGSDYIGRFLPTYYTVKRDMYKTTKGDYKHRFEAAFRRTEVANWEAAITDWIAIANSADPETAGRACFDIAVSYEVLGDNDKALEWAKRSYEEYGNKMGKEYVDELMR